MDIKETIMAKGQPEPAEAKSNIPQAQVQALSPKPTMPLQFNKPQFNKQAPSMAELLAQSGTGSPSRQFDPNMAQQMLNQR